MSSVIHQVIKNRKITLFIVIGIMIFGFYSYYITPKQESPDITPPIALLTAVYPGASPSDVEKLVTSKIEDKAAEITGFDYSQSDSKNSLSIVIVRLDQEADVEKAWTEMRQKMDDLKKDLPDECREIEINTDLDATAGMIISMSGENHTYEELASYAEGLKDELSKINGVSKFELDGKQQKEVRVDVDAAMLNYYRLSLDDISKLIQVQNIEVPSGTLNTGQTKINVKLLGTYSSVEEIENTILDVSKETGAVVRLKDIAKISIVLEDANYKIRHNGRNAVLLTGYFKPNKNIVIIGQEVKEKINEFKSKLPEGILFDEVLFQPDDVGKAVNDFVLNLLEGMLFVVIVVLIGMGFRNAIIVSTAIPLSILMTFSFMNLFEVKIHQISIAALIIALGMLVDNAIVVTDAIQVRIDEGMNKMSACLEGVKSVAVPVLTSTLTTVAAFIPLLMLPSVAGEYIRSLPLIVIISLMSSYLVALFFTPAIAFMLFKKSKPKEKVSRVRNFFDSLLTAGLKRKKSVIFICIASLGGAVLAVSYLGLQFFPKADKNIIYMDIKTEQSTNIEKTEQLVDTVSKILEAQKEILSYTASIGDGLPKFYNTIPINVQSQDYAQIMMRLDLAKGKRFKTNSEFGDFLQEEFDDSIVGGSVTVKLLEQGEPIGAPVRLRVTGNDMRRLGEVADEIRAQLSHINGTVNIEDDYPKEVYEFSIGVDSDVASSMGISRYDLQREVSIALRGREASIFRNRGNEYNIVVRSNISTKEDLENLAVKSSITGNKVLLKQVAKVHLEPQIPTIKKYNRELSVTVYSDVKSGYSSAGVQDQLKLRLKELDLDDVSVVFDGEKEKIVEYFGSVGVSSIIAVFLIYFILFIQFNSFVQPLMILVTIPLSAIGSVFGLFALRQPLSFMSLLGIVSLFGIVVNNAIILLDFINEERKHGRTIKEACMEAAGKRFRPIMLSTTTTVIGLTPLAVSGSNLFLPMSVSLMSGLMISTLLTLVVVPIVYNIVESRIENRFEISNNKSEFYT